MVIAVPQVQTPQVPIEVADPVNAKILAVSEDRIAGFLVDPITEIAARSGVELETVIERLRAMLAAGTIRRIRQTLMATSLAPGALVAWKIAPEKLDAGFDFLFKDAQTITTGAAVRMAGVEIGERAERRFAARSRSVNDSDERAETLAHTSEGRA